MESGKHSSSSSADPLQLPPTNTSLEIISNQEQLFKRSGELISYLNIRSMGWINRLCGGGAGTIWTAMAHIITGVIGAGVLSLAWSTAQLGWVAGPLAILVFAAITQISILLVCDCYRSPHPAHGPTRNRSFIQAVNFYLGIFIFIFISTLFQWNSLRLSSSGKKKQTICGIFVLESFYGCGIAYTIVTASSVK